MSADWSEAACVRMADDVVICVPPRGVHRRRILQCWNCKVRRRIIETHRGIWYGAAFVCCHCGDGWADGETMERPFRRGWRRERITEALRDWQQALPAGEYQAIVHAELESYFAATSPRVEDVVSDL